MEIRLTSIYLAVALLVLVLPSSASASSFVKAPNNLGLVGYWPFNEGTGLKAGDFSGYGNTGTLTSGPSWTGGKLGGGLSFDGTDDYVATGKALNSFISASTGTMSVWVKPTGASPTGGAPYQVQGIISDVAAYQGIFRGVISGEDRIWIYNWDGNGDRVGVPYTTNEWIHVVWVHSGGSLYAYANGAFVGSTASGNTLDLTQLVNIGLGYQAFPDFTGSIDEVRVYNRALGANEITRLYQASSAKIASVNTSGLIAYWNFDACEGSNLRDDSLRGNTGTLSGFAYTGTTSNWVSGANAKRGCALAFDGSNDYVEIADSAGLDFVGGKSYSYGMWIKTTSTGNTVLLEKGVNGFFMLQPNVGGNDLFINSVDLVVGGWTPFRDGQWRHLFVVYDVSANTATLYKDGESIAVITSAGGSSANDSPLHIGSRGGSYPILASIDEVRIYSRALSASEIRSVYNETSAVYRKRTIASSSTLTAGTSLASGLVGHWTFDGAHMTGTGGTGTARDASGNGNHGTLTNSPARTLGKLGQALSFDGVNDYVNAGNGASLTLTDLTISFWFKPTITFDSSTGRKDLLAKFLSYWVILNYPATDGRIALAVNGGGNITTTQTSWTAGTWYHFVGTLSGTTGTIYVNGAQSSTGSVGSVPSVQSYTLQLGGTTGTATYGNFTMDDVRIYNRALSAAEVKQLYNLAR